MVVEEEFSSFVQVSFRQMLDDFINRIHSLMILYLYVVHSDSFYLPHLSPTAVKSPPHYRSLPILM